MRTNLLLFGIIASTWAVTAQAQPPGARGDGHRPPHNPFIDALDADGDHEITFDEIEEAAAMLKEQDVNGDKKLTGDEIADIPGLGGGPGRPGRSGSGRSGSGRGGPGRGGPDDGGGMAERLMSFDKNKDGKLAADELPERMQRLIKGADADGDGSVDKNELADFAAKRHGDRDSDSSVERREDGDRRGRGPGGRGPGARGTRGRGPSGQGGPDGQGRPGGQGGFGGPHGPPSPERMVEHAFEFDANEDGQLSKEEMSAFAKELGKRRRGPGGRRGRDGEDGRPERPRRP